MNQAERETITNIHRMAFGEEEGNQIAELAENFLALPETISVGVERDERIVGNVLYTPFFFHDHPEAKCYLLAPNGVMPEYQGQGVGKELMETGIQQLEFIGADAIFVLGVPRFYPKYGFVPTRKQTPCPDLLTMPEAWMVHELNAGTVEQLSGNTTAVEPFMHSHFWDTSSRG